ncbi:MAG: TlpA family protein disulfide reductase [Acidobacteria bacterium]|nr:TlpA family protein disulfide reductase [Acidobacteriota bacterium]
MSKQWLKVVTHATILCFLFAVLASASASRIGTDDVPELPMPDGSGDTPEMTVALVPASAAAKPAKFKLSSLRGKVALLDMFWSKCPHCQDHAPHVVAIYNQYKDRGFTVLGLAKDSQDSADEVKSVKDYMATAKINYPTGFVTTEVVAYYADSRNHGVPQMVLFGADGKMIFREIGWNENIEQKLKGLIEEQLAKLPAKSVEQKPAAAKPAARPAQQKSKRG